MGLEKIGLQGVFETQAFSKGLKTYTDGVNKATGQTEKASESVGSKLSGAIIGTVASYLSLAAVLGTVTAVMRESLSEAADEESSLISLDATVKSMGLSAQTSALGIRQMAEDMQKANGVFSHDDLEQAAQSFLKIEGFDPSNLKNVLAVVQDFAAGTGTDAANAAQSIATALETGQTRSLHFSAALRTQITAMIAAGDQAGALSLIMDTLNSKYGGQAAAAMDTYNGKLEILKNDWSELLATIGGAELPAGKGLLSFLDQIVIAMTAAVSHMDVWEHFFGGIGLIISGNMDEGITEIRKAQTEAADALNKTKLVAQTTSAEWARGGQDTAEAWLAARGSIDKFNDSAQKLTDYAKQLSNITGYAHAYRTGIENVTKAENDLLQAEQDLHALQVGDWSETDDKVVSATQKVEDMKVKLNEAQQASRDATNEMIAGFLQAQLTMDGVFDESDMNKVLNYRLQMGLLTQDEYQAALAALQIAENLAAIEDKTVNINVIYSGLAGPIPSQAINRAGGGYVPPGYSSIVGDWPGMTTGYEELIKAIPGGGVQVYSHNQMNMPKGSRGSSSKNVTNNITINNPSAEPASTSVDGTIRRMNYLGYDA